MDSSSETTPSTSVMTEKVSFNLDMSNNSLPITTTEPDITELSPLTVMFSHHYEFAYLKIFVKENDTELADLYKEAVKKHNINMFNDPFPNSGFDIFVPEEYIFKCENQFRSHLIDMNIKCEMRLFSSTDRQFYEDLMKTVQENESINIKYSSLGSAFDLLPRSSICKTPLMLANHVGLIDMGYRGWIMGALRSFASEDYIVEKHTRLLQICHPSRCPIYVEVVPSESNISETIRGDGGFGSTGKVGV